MVAVGGLMMWYWWYVVAAGGLMMLVVEVCGRCGWANYIGTGCVWSPRVG